MGTFYRKFNREVLVTALSACLNVCRFTVGATGAVGSLYQAKSNTIRSITKTATGVYTVQFNLPFPAAIAFFDGKVQTAGAADPLVNLEMDAGSYNNETGTLTMRSKVELTDGVVATGTVQCETNANMTDGDYVTISDGITAVLYEYDKAGNGVTGGRTSWAAGAGTAEQTAQTLKTAIEATQPTLTVTTNGTGLITLTQQAVGTVGNVTITENATHAGVTVSGFASGVNPTGAAVQLPENAEVQLFVIELRSESVDVAST